jgi:hypothetical protein
MKLEQILADMDLPETRKDIARFANVRWLLRNIHFNNGEHKHLKRAIEMLKKEHKRHERRMNERT